MEDLIYAYTRFKEEKAKFDTLQQINPRDDDALYKYLLHHFRDLREDLVERCDEILISLESIKRVFEIEKELIYDMDLR